MGYPLETYFSRDTVRDAVTVSALFQAAGGAANMTKVYCPSTILSLNYNAATGKFVINFSPMYFNLGTLIGANILVNNASGTAPLLAQVPCDGAGNLNGAQGYLPSAGTCNIEFYLSSTLALTNPAAGASVQVELKFLKSTI